MSYFKTDRLVNGAEAVDAIYEAAELLGLNVIKLLDKMGGRSISGVSGFEVPLFSHSSDGRGRRTAVLDIGSAYFYPDKNGDKWGFVVDTDYNREIIASHYAAPTFKPADKNIVTEIEEYCVARGMQLTPTADVNPYLPTSKNVQLEEKRKLELEAEAGVLSRKLEQMKREIEEAELALAHKKSYADKARDITVVEKTVDSYTGEVVDTEVKATTVNINKEPAKKEIISKVGRQLKGKSITRK